MRDYSLADNADNAEECSRLHYIAEKDSLVRLRLFCGFVVCLRLSARSAGDIGVSSVQLFEYSCVNILPQIPQITQRNAAGLHYFADKRQLAQMNLLKQMPQITLRKTVTT